MLYPQGVAFRAQLFACEDGRVLIELQRRSGCCVAFAGMFRQLRASLLAQRLVVDHTATTSGSRVVTAY